jgi:hypothetical protein
MGVMLDGPPYGLFVKYKQIFVRDEKEVVFDAVGLPVARRFAVVLLFDDDLFGAKSSLLVDLHHIKAHRHNMPVLARIAHQRQIALSGVMQNDIARDIRRLVASTA